MGSKKLVRIKELKEEWCSLLQNHNITTCKDVLSKSSFELMNVLQSYKVSTDVLQIVSKVVAPQPCSALEVSRQKESRYLTTCLPSLNEMMHGGMIVGTITELAGPPGCGKTQFSMTMSAVVAISSCLKGVPGSVVYIDTENSFSAHRIREIIEQKVCATHLNASDVAARVIIIHEATHNSFYERLKCLEETIIMNKVRLVVVDSIASLVRKEFGTDDQHGRNTTLMNQAAMLKYYAETFNICVLVTNQITNTGQTSDLINDTNITIPALGNTWAHAVNTRLSVTVNEKNKRKMTLAKSPIAPVSSIYYKIGPEGVFPVT